MSRASENEAPGVDHMSECGKHRAEGTMGDLRRNMLEPGSRWAEMANEEGSGERGLRAEDAESE